MQSLASFSALGKAPRRRYTLLRLLSNFALSWASRKSFLAAWSSWTGGPWCSFKVEMNLSKHGTSLSSVICSSFTADASQPVASPPTCCWNFLSPPPPRKSAYSWRHLFFLMQSSTAFCTVCLGILKAARVVPSVVRSVKKHNSDLVSVVRRRNARLRLGSSRAGFWGDVYTVREWTSNLRKKNSEMRTNEIEKQIAHFKSTFTTIKRFNQRNTEILFANDARFPLTRLACLLSHWVTEGTTLQILPEHVSQSLYVHTWHFKGNVNDLHERFLAFIFVPRGETCGLAKRIHGLRIPLERE